MTLVNANDLRAFADYFEALMVVRNHAAILAEAVDQSAHYIDADKTCELQEMARDTLDRIRRADDASRGLDSRDAR